MFKVVLIYLLTLLTFQEELYSDMGCKILEKASNSRECVEPNILNKSYILDDLLEEEGHKIVSKAGSKRVLKRVKITEKLDSIDIIFQKKRLKIERLSERECPPECISPIEIDKSIKTVGEIETIAFIDSFQKKRRGKILVDARGVVEYKKGTIPVAINIPYSMVSPKSRYRNEILRLLGVKIVQKRYFFKGVRKLLIFDNGILDSRASSLIKTLIKIGYPKRKILYYRGGFKSWRDLGLTTI